MQHALQAVESTKRARQTLPSTLPYTFLPPLLSRHDTQAQTKAMAYTAGTKQLVRPTRLSLLAVSRYTSPKTKSSLLSPAERNVYTYTPSKNDDRKHLPKSSPPYSPPAARNVCSWKHTHNTNDDDRIHARPGYLHRRQGVVGGQERGLGVAVLGRRAGTPVRRRHEDEGDGRGQVRRRHVNVRASLELHPQTIVRFLTFVAGEVNPTTSSLKGLEPRLWVGHPQLTFVYVFFTVVDYYRGATSLTPRRHKLALSATTLAPDVRVCYGSPFGAGT